MHPEIPEDRERSYPCECGGNITLSPSGKYWDCDECNLSHEDLKLLLKRKGE